MKNMAFRGKAISEVGKQDALEHAHRPANSHSTARNALSIATASALTIGGSFAVGMTGYLAFESAGIKVWPAHAGRVAAAVASETTVRNSHAQASSVPVRNVSAGQVNARMRTYETAIRPIQQTGTGQTTATPIVIRRYPVAVGNENMHAQIDVVRVGTAGGASLCKDITVSANNATTTTLINSEHNRDAEITSCTLAIRMAMRDAGLARG